MSPHRPVLHAAIGAAAAVVLTCCGSSAGTPATDPTAQHQLRQDLQMLTNAAATGHYHTAQFVLRMLDKDLAANLAAGKISDRTGNQIRAAAAKVQADLAAAQARITTPTTTSPKPSSSSSPPPPPPASKAKNGHSHGHGKSDHRGKSDHHGHGHDDGDS